MHDLIIPTNEHEERQKFFASDDYNPQFHYKWQEISPELRYLPSSKQRISLFTAVYSQNQQAIVAAAQTLFTTIIESDKIKQAKQIASNRPEPRFDISSNTVIPLIKEQFAKFGIDYQIKLVDTHSYNFRPHHQTREFLVSKHLQLEFLGLEGQLKHELTHIIRHKNTEFNQIQKSANYLPTEEGLASYVSDFLCNETGALYQHAVQYLATELSLRASFREVYNFYLDHGFSQSLAWQRTLKNKQGFCDTSKPGDFMKLAMYFYHELEVQKLSLEQIIRLFVGKISIQDLAQYPQYRGWLGEALLQTFLFSSSS